MQKLNVHEAKTKLSAVLSEIEKKGETFIICRNGKPTAELIPYRRHSRLKYHPLLRKIKINFDPTEDMTDSEWGEIE
ncbi:MAG: type II toxin-antitoxin system Phd/YefM family antitoxin [Desulfobacteraceae bacterium]|nr:MAG: type II toxin-antitoxin system Phd/YefM family antitoxin [Desulfobacteraceae bacterium]